MVLSDFNDGIPYSYFGLTQSGNTKLQCYKVTRYILVEWGMCQVWEKMRD